MLKHYSRKLFKFYKFIKLFSINKKITIIDNMFAVECNPNFNMLFKNTKKLHSTKTLLSLN